MTSATIVEILLGVLTVIVGVISYHGSSKATQSQALAAEAEVDAQAYERARLIYESAIDALEEHVNRLREQMRLLDGELTQLRESNVLLKTQITELQIGNARLEAELRSLREGH